VSTGATGGGARPDPARRVAFAVLRAVAESGAYANLVLPERLRAAGISGRDAAFATELTYGTLRRSGTYDVIAAACVDRPWSSVDRPVQDLLRLGAHQLLGMNVPRHAAVATTVELAKAEIGRGRAGFVNAVLRRVGERSYDAWVDKLSAGSDPSTPEALGLRHAHPPWLVRELHAALTARGRPEPELVDLLEADNRAPEVTLVARPGRCSLQELLAAGARQGRWTQTAAAWPSGDPGSLPAVREQRAGVQDEGSQMVTAAVVAADVTGGTDWASGGELWLDMCAGPGGKAALLAALAAERGASLQAWELLPHRARLVSQAVGDGATVRVVDAGDPRRVAESTDGFDRVLLDAPCSGAGALRRRPEARWRKQLDDLPALVAGQRRLLENALRLVRPGGVVGYTTCSPLLDETTGVVDAVLSGRTDVQRLDVRDLLPGQPPDIGSGPDAQLWPHLHGTDAMYLALLRRVGPG
jgi:16S rRNA (cytosine967-C5)-methyltransferase